jgi:hypothetical protein
MKTQVKFFQLIIAIAMSALISFGFYSMDIESNKLLIAIGGFVFFAITLACTIGIQFETAGVSTNVRVLSSIFFVVGLVSHVVFSFFSSSVPLYVIVNGIVLLVYALIVNGLIKAAS